MPYPPKPFNLIVGVCWCNIVCVTLDFWWCFHFPFFDLQRGSSKNCPLLTLTRQVCSFVSKDEGTASEFVRVLYIRGMLPLQTQLDHLPLIVAFPFSMKPYSRNNSIRSCWVLFVYFLLCEVWTFENLLKKNPKKQNNIRKKKEKKRTSSQSLILFAQSFSPPPHFF